MKRICILLSVATLFSLFQPICSFASPYEEYPFLYEDFENGNTMKIKRASASYEIADGGFGESAHSLLVDVGNNGMNSVSFGVDMEAGKTYVIRSYVMPETDLYATTASYILYFQRKNEDGTPGEGEAYRQCSFSGLEFKAGQWTLLETEFTFDGVAHIVGVGNTDVFGTGRAEIRLGDGTLGNINNGNTFKYYIDEFSVEPKSEMTEVEPDSVISQNGSDLPGVLKISSKGYFGTYETVTVSAPYTGSGSPAGLIQILKGHSITDTVSVKCAKYTGENISYTFTPKDVGYDIYVRIIPMNEQGAVGQGVICKIGNVVQYVEKPEPAGVSQGIGENEIIYESFNNGTGIFQKAVKWYSSIGISSDTGKYGNALKITGFYGYDSIKLSNAVLLPNRAYKISYWVKGISNYENRQSCFVVAKDHKNALGNVSGAPTSNYEYAGIPINGKGVALTNEWQYVEGIIYNTVTSTTDEVGYCTIYPMIYTYGHYGDAYKIPSGSPASFMIDELKIETMDIALGGDMTYGLNSSVTFNIFTYNSNVTPSAINESDTKNTVAGVICKDGQTGGGMNDIYKYIALEPGERYVLSWRAKTRTGTNNIIPIFDRVNANLEGTPAQKYQYLKTETITPEWKTYKQEFIAPPETSSDASYRHPRFLLRATGQGTLYIDDIKIEKINQYVNNISIEGAAIQGESVSIGFSGDDAQSYEWRMTDPEGMMSINSGTTDHKAFSVTLPQKESVRIGIKPVFENGSKGEEIFFDIDAISAYILPQKNTEKQFIGTEFPDSVWAPDFEDVRAKVSVKNLSEDLTGFIALYDENERLIRVSSKALSEGVNMLSVAAAGGECAKVMVFNDLFKPRSGFLKEEKDTESKFVFVSKNGKSTNPGTYDKPINSITNAQRKAKTLGSDKDIYIMIRSDEYILSSPISIKAGNSLENKRITYASYGGENGEKAVISGGKEISGWVLHDESKNIWKAPVTDTNITNFRQIYVNGIKAQRARDYIVPAVASEDDEGYTVYDMSLADIGNIEDVEFVYWYKWTNPRFGIESITKLDNGTSKIKMDPTGWALYRKRAHIKPSAPSFIENAYEFMDLPGEWYFDQKQKYLYYIPRSGEDMNNISVTVPYLEKLLTIDGTYDAPVKNITLKNLSFEYSNWIYPDENGYSDAQSGRMRISYDIIPSAAVEIVHSKNINIEDCSFTRLGMSALTAMWGIENINITGNSFYDISGSGMYVGTPYKKEDLAKEECRNILIKNNYFADLATDYNSCVPIATLWEYDCEVSNNECVDVPYSGIHGGYGGKADMTGIVYKDNYFNRVLNGKLYDGGSVYFTGRTGGTAEDPNIVTGNYSKEQMNDTGVYYPDNHANGWLMYDNVADLSEAPEWNWHAARWFLTNGSKDLWAHNNYSTNGTLQINETYVEDLESIQIDPAIIYDPLSPPDRVKEIIDASGLEEGYYARLSPRYQLTKTLSNNIKVKRGMKIPVILYGEGGKAGRFDPQNIVIRNDTPDIISTDINGEFSAKNVGVGKLTVYTDMGEYMKNIEIFVTVY